jgi:glutamate synthase domain-containing protein 2
MRKQFFIGSFIIVAVLIGGYFFLPEIYRPIHTTISVIMGVLIGIGVRDALQSRQTIKRNFPLVGHFRYLLEGIRPEIQQYFIESNTDGMPFSREDRSLIYQRSKGVIDTVPFGTQRNVYHSGYEWVNHSILARNFDPKSLRVEIGGKDCSQKYSASILNISAMSYGSLSKNAVLSLNGGAADGNFAHNTGEGSISPYHLKYGGDLVWQIGTGYFGCRDDNGNFDESQFSQKSQMDNVKMIEIKISQGAKPGHGGLLPKEKITKEISEIRNVPMNKDIKSPATHSEFETPVELMNFIKKLRDLSKGKPVGIKLCIGKRREFMSICKAMIETKITPDYICIDGAEGGTGAAPLEFTNYLGVPSIDGLVYVHNCLKGLGLRDQVKIICTGKISTGFGIIKCLALGADLVYSARAMMISLGCIQALRCNSNICPAGIATQDKNLMAGLVVKDKRKRVKTFHEKTVKSVADLLGAMGLQSTSELRPWHIITRVGTSQNKDYSELFTFVKNGDFLKGEFPPHYKAAFDSSTHKSFDRV